MSTTQRSFASGITFSLGLLSAQFDVAPIRLPEKRRVSVCPECEGNIKLTQVMHCPNGHQMDLASAARAVEVDGELIGLSEDDVLDLREDEGVQTGLLALEVCPRAELEVATRPGESQYRVRLNKKARSGEQYALFLRLATHPDLALYGVVKLNGRVTPTPFRLGVWQGQLVLTSLIRPSNLAEIDQIDADCSDELLALGEQYMAAVAQPFDAESLTDGRKVRLDALLKGKTAAPAIVVTPAVTRSLEELLTAALAA